MPEVVFTEPVRQVQPKAAIITDTGTSVELTWAPAGTTLDGLAAVWSQLSRPGRKPMTVKTAQGLKTLSLTALMGSGSPETSIEAQLALLRKMAASGARVKVVYGWPEGGWWRITAMAETSALRNSANQVVRATVTFTFTEDVPGGPPVAAKSVWRIHVWKSGDSMHALAYRYLGNRNRWREIMTANKLRSARVAVGTKLRIPPR